jgi:hypothetical protein
MGNDGLEKTEDRLAVAIHEAAHAVVATALGTYVQSVELTQGSFGHGGRTSVEMNMQTYSDCAAYFLAGNIAVQEILGRALPFIDDPSTDEVKIKECWKPEPARESQAREGGQRVALKIVRANKVGISAMALALINATDEGRRLDGRRAYSSTGVHQSARLGVVAAGDTIRAKCRVQATARAQGCPHQILSLRYQAQTALQSRLPSKQVQRLSPTLWGPACWATATSRPLDVVPAHGIEP